MAPADDTTISQSQNLGAGEYGASRVVVTKDGSIFRVAFGRNNPTSGQPVFYSAVFLSVEAAKELLEQLNEFLP